MTKTQKLEQARRWAYMAAKRYMKDIDRPTKVAEMNEKDLKLFTFMREVNERIHMSRTRLRKCE